MPPAKISGRPYDAGGSNDANGFAQQLFTGLPKRYDFLEALLSFGQNGRWRRSMVDHVVTIGTGRILDVATGTAGVALQLAERASADIIGLDLTEAMLRQGQTAVDASRHAGRIHLLAGRAEQLPFPDGSFDALTFTYLLRYVADPAATLVELARVLKPGAPMASLEFHVPPNRFWRAWWWFYTRAVLPTAGGLAGRSWYRVGRFLGPSISRHYERHPTASIVAMWQSAGFVDVEVTLMSLGGGLVMRGRKRA
jgi:demethylmenaquinone methyltransferase/2-methoxy-6-polyprenyl-1,4-benzoquinol methylase